MTPLDYHFEQHRLDNGLRVVISENQRLPLLSMTACVVAGADQNPLELPGLATLTARLLDEGSRHFSAEQLAQRVENTGGFLSTFSRREVSGIAFSLVSHHLALGVETLAELLCRPVFPRHSFLRERERLLNHLRSVGDDPQRTAGQLLNRSIYRGTPLQHPSEGTVHGLRKTTVDDVGAFHRQKYAPQNTLLAVVGHVRSGDVLRLVEEQFGTWNNPRYRRTPLPEIGRLNAPEIQQLHMDKKQIHVAIGHLGVARRHPDFHALQLMDVILGSGPGFISRIPRRLREDLGLAYTTYSDIASSSGLCPGRFVAYISTSPKNQAVALEGMLNEIRRLREDGVTGEELSRARDFLTGSFVFDFQSNADLARFLILTELYDLGPDYPRRYPKILAAVSAAEVRRVARRHLDTVNYSQAIVGPIRGRHAQN